MCIIFYLLFVTGKTGKIENFSPLSDCKDDLKNCNDGKNKFKNDLNNCSDDKNRIKDDLKNCGDDKNRIKDDLKNCGDDKNRFKDSLKKCSDDMKTCRENRNMFKDERDTCNIERDTCNIERDNCNIARNACNIALNTRTDELTTCNTNLNNYTNYVNDLNLLYRKYSYIFPTNNNASQEPIVYSQEPIVYSQEPMVYSQESMGYSQEFMELPTQIAMYPLQNDFRNMIIASSINITPKIDSSGYVFTNNALLIKSTNIGDVFTFSIGQSYKAISYWLYCDHIKMNLTFNNEDPVIKDTYNKILENYIPNKKWICISINIGKNAGDLDVYVTDDDILKKINYSQDREQKRAISLVMIKISLLSLINNLSVYDRALSENDIRELNIRTPIRTDIIDNY